MNEKVVCPLCGETMLQQRLPKSKDIFWECPGCSCEVWPYVESIERRIRKLMQPVSIQKKGRGSRRKRRFKTKKPGEKFVPWYQRF